MSQQPFGDIPLFREIQRLLASSDGPINFEVARQVAVSLATGGTADAVNDTAAAAALDEAVRAAELALSGYTRLPLPAPGRARVIGRAEWVETTLGSWRWWLEPLARRLSEGMVGADAADPGQGRAEPQSIPGAIAQIAPLLLGAQAGTLIGQLAQETLARYDLPIPRDDDEVLFFILRNVGELSDAYGFDRETFLRWLALHHVARHLPTTTAPWIGRYARSLFRSVIAAVEVDVGAIERRLMDLQSGGMESLQDGSGLDEPLPLVASERHTAATRQVRALVAVLDGYAGHAAGVVAAEVLDPSAAIEEAMLRRDLSTTQGERMLKSLLGLTPDRALDAQGRTFCAAVAELHGLSGLNRLWEAPDNLPSIEEIRDPFAWIERVLEP